MGHPLGAGPCGARGEGPGDVHGPEGVDLVSQPGLPGSPDVLHAPGLDTGVCHQDRGGSGAISPASSAHASSHRPGPEPGAGRGRRADAALWHDGP